MGFLGTFSRTLQFDIISPLPRRLLDERLRPVVRTPEGDASRAIFRGELQPQGFSLRRRALFPGMLVTLKGTYIPESSGTRVVVLANGQAQAGLAFGIVAVYIGILIFALRAYMLDQMWYGGSTLSLLVLPVGFAIPAVYLIAALWRAKRGLDRDRIELERLLLGSSQMR